MKITVLDVLEAHVRADEFDLVVSVINHPSSLWDDILKHPRHIVEYFSDDEQQHWSTAPKQEQIERILNATADLPEDSNVLVHCQAGQCRSTAMAIAIAVQHGKDPTEAAQELFDDHHCEIFWPNKLVLLHAAAVLDKPELLKDVLKWMSKLDTTHW